MSNYANINITISEIFIAEDGVLDRTANKATGGTTDSVLRDIADAPTDFIAKGVSTTGQSSSANKVTDGAARLG